MAKTTKTRDNEFLSQITFEPLSRKNWDKFVELFGVKGACGNCWCTVFRLKKQEHEEGKADGGFGNREYMKSLVWADRPTGLLGFYEGQPIGWLACAPREDFIKIENSRVHKRIDDKPVWAVPCFFIHKDFRGQGVSVAMLKGLIDYARKQKIKILEAYPTIPTTEKLPDAFGWIGLYRSFEEAGFEVVDRTSKNRPMVRYYINE